MAHDSITLRVVEVIIRAFVRGGLSNTAPKRHLQAMMAIDNKKVKSNDAEKCLVISFSDDDYLERFNREHNDLMVITAIIHYYAIKRILLDEGSLVDILYNVTTTSMNITKSDLKPNNGNLIKFSSK